MGCGTASKLLFATKHTLAIQTAGAMTSTGLLVIMTLWAGLKGALRATPWRPMLLAVWATFLGVAVEGAIIDSDHWRHFWLLMGVLWGGAIAAGRYARALPRTSAAVETPRAEPQSLQPDYRITIVRGLSERGAARLAH